MLFNQIIFGPVHSRRLGVSLGINLLPEDIKLCTYNCIYCECGWGETEEILSSKLLSADVIVPVLEEKFKILKANNVHLDSITYSGNGEPTVHPQFGEITEQLMRLRDAYFPQTIITCLSNSTQLHRADVLRALLAIDNPIMKLDTGIQTTFEQINKPFYKIQTADICKQLTEFQGNLTIQTLFLKGKLDDGTKIDNTTEAELSAWLDCLKIIKPHTAMLYPIDRETPARNLVKIEKNILEQIAKRVENLGIKALIY
ncbi:MAG: radical SAM protein [Lentimicrobiaceae bacterium]|nr:radical SAM protein [Lentimicrobiaceae bacterium]